MKIFSVFVGWNSGHTMPFRVPIDGNTQRVVEGNGNHIITGVENALENSVFGEGH